MAEKCEKILSNEFFNLHKCRDGYWLYDHAQGMNLAMRAETEHQAFTEAMEYYQERTQKLLSENKTMKSKLKSFVIQFINSDGEFECDFD